MLPKIGLSFLARTRKRINRLTKSSSLILVSEPEKVTVRSIEDACLLARASSDSLTVIGVIPDSILADEVFSSFFSGPTILHVQSDIWDQLDNFALTDDLLIVCIGNTSDVHMYLSKRLQSSSGQVVKWQIVSSTYARYALLEQRRTLSGFIPQDTTVWLRELIKKFGKQRILTAFDGLSSIKVLLIGETIIDEYVYCTALGKVSKDPLVAFEVGERTLQLGGILAVAKHFAGLGATVAVWSPIGTNQEQFVQRNIHPQIRHNLYPRTSTETICKTRYVDRASNVRVFETYNLPQDDYSQNNKDFAKLLPIIDPDVITVVDYGHGFIDETVIAELGNTKILVSANAQSNAGNRGFNPISKYKGIPMLFLNGSEVEVETRTKTSDLKSTVESLANGLETDEFYVTNGSGGLICWKKDAETFIAPAFAPSIVDRTGAGDALLSSITLLRRSGVEREIAAFYGNISGALLTGAMGNELSLSRDVLLEQAEEIIDTVMKGE